MFDRIDGTRIAAPVLVALLAVGCGGGEGGEETPGAEEEAQMESPVDPATAGAVSGRVLFEGTAPEAEAIDMSSEPQCADQHETPPMTRQVVVNDDGSLSNVFVHVTEGLGDRQFPTSQEAVELDQEGCRYEPHVVGIQTGQTLTIRNSDGFLHNINAQPSANRGFNISQPVDMTSERTFPVPEVMIPVQCDVHGWMSAYIGVTPHPYHSVTGSDGSFSLETLPPGDYVLEAWHERYGTQTANVTVATGETAEVEFTFNESMAESADVPLGEPIDLHDHGAPGIAPSSDR